MTLKSFSGKERRAYVRLERSLPVQFKISANQMSKTYTATTKNISQGGLCLEIYQDARQLIENLATADSKVGIDLDTLTPYGSFCNACLDQQPGGLVAQTDSEKSSDADRARI